MTPTREDEIRAWAEEEVKTLREILLTMKLPLDQEGWLLHGMTKPELVLWLLDENDRLRALCRDAYEAWAGSECGIESATDREAYSLHVISRMLEPLRDALTGDKTNDT